MDSTKRCESVLMGQDERCESALMGQYKKCLNGTVQKDVMGRFKRVRKKNLTGTLQKRVNNVLTGKYKKVYIFLS